jgi:predicted MFS family arabinose efflux permease
LSAAAAVASAGRPLAVAILALTLGHVFSNAVRTIPAIAADVLMRDLGLTEEGLAAITGAFPLVFALMMLPVGVALDRWGVRRTALTLLGFGMAGSVIGAAAQGPGAMLLAQVVLGIGCSGMLMCPTTFAARVMDARRFALWSGLILALGNCGMLLSASPLALLVQDVGWRAGFLAAAGLAALAWAAVFVTVRETPAPPRAARSIATEMGEVLAIAASPALRPLLVFGLASLAVVLGVRGLWGGPWLMEVKGLDRVEAGNVLLLFTVALVAGPAIAGLVHRAVGRAALLLAGSHLAVAALLVVLVAGGPGGPLAWVLGQPMLPPAFDATVLTMFGLIISFQVLVFTLAREVVPMEQAGRALSAVNIGFFAGAAILQGVSGVAASVAGVGAALLTFALALLLCTGGFLLLRGGTR